MTTYDDIVMIQKMGASELDATDVAEFALGQVLLDVNNGRIYAIRSNGTNLGETGDRIYWWGYDGYISLTFSIASFSDGQGSSQLIGGTAAPGSGASSSPSQWVAGTSLAFLASYSNGPPVSPFPYIVGPTEWTSTDDRLAMDSVGGYTSATESSAQDTNYPSSVGGNKTFTLYATDGTTPDTQATSVTFYNERCNGLSTATSLTSANINSLGSKVVTSGKNGTFTFSPSANEYIYIAYRAALGASTFTVGGIGVELEWLTEDATVAHTNSAGFTEPYHVYRSTNHSLATTTIVVS